MTTRGVHTAPNGGETGDWLTPPELLAALGPFDLDPCCPPVMPWRTATRMLTPADNGLAHEWHGRVFLNPPYGSAAWQWLWRLAEHGDGIGLVMARTETAGFFRSVWGRADALLFLEGRLYFHRPDGSVAGNAGAPSVLVAYGARNAAALAESGVRGAYVAGWQLTEGGK